MFLLIVFFVFFSFLLFARERERERVRELSINIIQIGYYALGSGVEEYNAVYV